MSVVSVPLLRVDRVSKRFPGVVALDSVCLQLKRAEVLAVVGENGAGKSTLMKILAGIVAPDEGQLLVDGVPQTIDSVQKAQSLGIALIHQELYLCQNLNVVDNIFLGREPHHFGFIDRHRIRRLAAETLQEVGLHVSPDANASELTIGQQQMVEIAKAVSTDARMVIMDEPTSSLSQHEADNLFEIIRALKSRGVSVIYISHRLGEVERVADRVVVLRDGRNAGELQKGKIEHKAMVEKMVGRELSKFYHRRALPSDDVVVSVNGIRTELYPHHEVRFEIRRGEILGLAGLVGAGRTELLTTLFGLTPARAGAIEIEGRPRNITDPRSAIRFGLALVPEDRKRQGLVLQMTVCENTSLPTLAEIARGGWIDFQRDRQLAEQMRRRLDVRTPSVHQNTGVLSGGNQQKVVIGKWLATSPKLLMLDEPTRGVDIGAKQEIYQLMDELAQSGVAILFVSSDMEEILGMSDRILVMHQGQIAGELQKQQFSEQAVMNLATGIQR